MRILITGSRGLIGSALVPFLKAEGHETARVVRPGSNRAAGVHAAGDSAARDSAAGNRAAGDILWDPAAGHVDSGAMEGFDAAIHLAGENLGEGRWSVERKRALIDSRVQGTRLLSETLAKLRHPPGTLVSVSAIGYYGDRGDELVTEESAAGVGFLPEIAQAWEAAAEPARRAGLRVVHPRLAMVLSTRGGALAKLLTPFRLGLGTRFGSGMQYMSWITIDDVSAAFLHLIEHPELAGPVNLSAPGAVRNREFTRILGRVLSRPALLAAPAFALRLLLGEMADEMLLSGARVEPQRLLRSGFRFRHPELEGALRHLLRSGEQPQ